MTDEQPKLTRNEFLRNFLHTILLLGLGALGYRGWLSFTQRITKKRKEGAEPNGVWYSMGLDITKCIGCGLCVQACRKENNVPDEHFRTWIERYVVKKDGSVVISSPNGGEDGFPDDIAPDDVLKSFFVPKLCNQCDHSPCTQVCPVGATFHTKEGVVLVDTDYCIGCRYCIQACPYGTRFFNPSTKTADKCTLCYHRITKGKLPACVEVCPVKARIFGDINDPTSEISMFIAQNQVMTLKPHLRTGAKVVYKGMSKEVS
jgi:Fe-S-cluster-containing dehydrogenase component